MRTRARKGLSLLEVLVAVAIIGGPLVYIIGGMISNTRAVGRHLDRATAQMLLTDIAEWIMAKPNIRPRALAKFATRELQERWIEAEADVSAEDKLQFARVVEELVDRMVVQVERAPQGKKGLCTVVISVELADKQVLSVPVLLRGVPRWHRGRKKRPQVPS